MVLVGTAGVWLVSRGWAEETHEVQAKDDEVTKDDNIDYNDEEIVEPETLTIAEGNITVTSRTFLPPNEWTFKSFGATHVDIHEDDPPDGLSRHVVPPTATNDTATRIKVEAVGLEADAALWPLRCEGNLQPGGGGGPGGPGTLPHWSAKVAKVEVKLKLNMRKDGEDNFIYPSFYDAEHYAEMIQYKAVELSAGIIGDVMVEVLDPDENVDWSSEDLGASADWKDSGFEGRTNYTRAADGSTDADNKPNEVQGLFKFVDPGSSGQATFTARLTVMLTGGGKLVETDTFQARARTVAIVNLAQDPPEDPNWGFGCYGKAWLWMTYGLTEGGTAECVNPAEDGDKLILDYREKVFGLAYECTTPRSVRLRSIHHGSADGQIRLPNWYRGFNWGGGVEGFLDVAGFAHSHHCTVDFLHCYSAKDGAGAAKSLADALSGRVGGGGGTVIGYNQTVGFTPGLSDLAWGALTTEPELPQDEYDYFYDCFEARAKESLYTPPEVHCEVEGCDQMHPKWIADHTITNVVSAVELDQNAIINAAKADYKDHFGKEPTFSVTLDEPISFYYVDSGEGGPKLYHKNPDGTKVPVTPSTFTAP